MTRSHDARRRLVEAMGLGPLWVRRAPAAQVDDEPGNDVDQDDPRDRPFLGLGVAGADWLVIGSGAGFAGDPSVEPPAGQVGKLRDAMLASVGLSRERNVFIIDIERWLSSRAADGIRVNLERLFEQVASKVILVMGEDAAAAVLGGDASLDSLRGRRHLLTIGGRDLPLVVTHHPADLLHAGEHKAAAWADLCFARDVFRQTETTSLESN